jgi:site-specific DNA-methyltransferase (adenine-specific)
MAFMRAQKDCIRVLGRRWEFKDVLAIVDPPTGQGEDGGKNRNGIRHKKKSWDDKRMPKEWIDELFRITKNQIIWEGDYYTDFLYPSPGWILWDKKYDNYDFGDFELAWTSFKRAKKIFRYCKIGGLNYKGRFIHPCQKPVSLYRWLLQNYARPGQLILDTHVGSGSSRMACYDLGFDFVGCELDRDYYQAQEARYRLHTANKELFPRQEIQDLVYQQKELSCITEETAV